MALAGPQVGGVSLIIHLVIILSIRIGTGMRRLGTIAANSFRKTYYQLLPNAKG